jgi:hypothetical protein
VSQAKAACPIALVKGCVRNSRGAHLKTFSLFEERIAPHISKEADWLVVLLMCTVRVSKREIASS